MDMSTLRFVVPQPLRDAAYCAHDMYKADQWSTSNDQFCDGAKALSVIAFRTALVGAAMIAVHQYKCNPARTTLTGAIISAPATMIAWGAKFLYEGAQSIYTNVIAKSYKEAAKGFGKFAVGYLMMELNNREELNNIYTGIGDSAFNKLIRSPY